MQKSIIPSLSGMCLICSLLYSCNENSGQPFATREDSVRFAQAVIQKYPGEKQGISLQSDTTPAVKGRNFRGPANMEPISWQTVVEYSANYDQDPQIKAPEGYYYKGFTVDSAGYSRLAATKAVKGIFLRLGKKEDGSYTVMVMGLDAKGSIITTDAQSAKPGGDSTNFDNLKPCPEHCPEGTP